MSRRLFFELRYLFGRPPWDTGVSPPELLAFLDSHPRGRALDLGCGTGTNVLTMARRGWQVTGIDFSAQAIARARRKVRRAGLQADLRHGDVTDLRGVDGPFDLALDIGCFHSLPPEGRARYVSHLARLLRPGATFLLYTFQGSAADGPQGWPTPEALAAAFDPAFAVNRIDHGTDRQRPSAWYTLQRKA